MGNDAPRALTLAALRHLWACPIEELEDACASEPHGPGALCAEEKDTLLSGDLPIDQVDVPDWVIPLVEKRFGDESKPAMAALSARADIDLRINTLKSTPAKALQALKSVGGKPILGFPTSARILAPDPSQKAPAVTIIPAFNKGWVEVQDLASQMAVAAAGDLTGKQVLDFCAGAGGKTLALAAAMENTGQLHAFDVDARRLKPLYARAKRAGLRNLQIMAPTDRKTPMSVLEHLQGKMDLVFVDAPCTGSGTWRRHPDTKWRLTEQQLTRRMKEQAEVLASAAQYVKPGGHLLYATCSIFNCENEDQIEAFLNTASAFKNADLWKNLTASNLIDEEGATQLGGATQTGPSLLMAPHTTQTDGFFTCLLQRESS